MLSWRRIAMVVVVLVAAKGVLALLAAQAHQAELPDSFTPSPEFQEWITNLVRQQLPEDYEKRKNWGHTAKSFDGVSIKVEDGRIKTHRKYEEKNDGEWQLYRVKLKDPTEKFDVKIANIRKLEGAKVRLAKESGGPDKR